MLRDGFYKDRPALFLEEGDRSGCFLPEDGGKLVTLRVGEREVLAQRQGACYRRLLPDTSYVKAECSAFDDMFPTIDPCEINGKRYLDHGEVSRLPWVAIADGDTLTLTCHLQEINAEFSKVITLCDGVLTLVYRMTNHTDAPLPCLWAGHIMLAGEEGAWVESPYTQADSITQCFGQPLSRQEAHVLPPIGATGEYKFYYDEPAAPMQCTVCYPSGGRVHFDFEGDAVRYLALWFNPGQLNGMYNLAVEPCTAPYDDPLRADAAGKGFALPPHGSVAFTLRILAE
jgi:hypothetical protein